MDNKKDLLDEMLSDNSGNDTETLEMISENCEVLSGEQKKRILDMIREKESTDKKTDEIIDDDSEDDNVMSVVEFRNRKSIAVKVCAALAACVCIAAGIKFTGAMNRYFISPDDEQEKTTGVSESVPETSVVPVTDNSGAVTVPVNGNVTEISEQVRTTEFTSVNAVSDKYVTTAETGAGDVSKNADTKQVTEQVIAANEIVKGAAASETVSGKTTEPAEENKESTVTSETEYHEVSQTEVTAGQEESKQPEYMVLYKRMFDKALFSELSNSYNDFQYIVYDINKDGVPELICEHRDKLQNQSIINFQTIEYHTVDSLDVKESGYQVRRVPLQNGKNPNYIVNGSVTFFEDSNTGRLCIEILDNGTGSMVSFDMDGRVVYEADALCKFEYGDDYNLFRDEATKKFSISEIEFGRVRVSECSVRSGHDKIRDLETGEYYFYDEKYMSTP